jgi:hypothetical protein
MFLPLVVILVALPIFSWFERRADQRDREAWNRWLEGQR